MYQVIIKWLEGHMLPCAYKSFFGMDCPGCGMQRAFIALLKGNITQSFKLYPAAIPIIIMIGFLLLDSRYKFDKTSKIKKSFYFFTGSIVLVSYVSKMILLYHH